MSGVSFAGLSLSAVTCLSSWAARAGTARPRFTGSDRFLATVLLLVAILDTILATSHLLLSTSNLYLPAPERYRRVPPPRHGGMNHPGHAPSAGTRDMAVEHHASSEDERVAALLIATAAALLDSQRSGVPKAFVDALFGQTVPEDVVRYDAREVAALAQSAWSFLAERKPGAPKIRLEAPVNGSVAGDRLEHASVLEIVNDDMPFLVDSVLDELTEKGADIQLVAHPVVSLIRDSGGRVIGFGDSPTAPGQITRESVIHVHITRIDDEARRAEIVRAIAEVLAEVRVCVHDWRPMIDRVQQIIASLKSSPPPL